MKAVLGVLLLVGVVLVYWKFVLLAIVLIAVIRAAPVAWREYRGEREARKRGAEALAARADDREPLIYYGYSGQTAWAFTTPEELGVWASEHPEGTFDVQVSTPAC